VFAQGIPTCLPPWRMPYSKEADKLSGQLQAFLSKNEKSERQRNN